ncbi:MAG: MBOAT family O-acyltransferase [Candidatus Korobacteraceae bacterium]
MLIRALLYSLAIVLAVVGLARLRSRSARQILLLVLSYALYLSWAWWFALVLLGSTLVNFLFGRSLRRTRSATTLWIGIVVNVALLSSFKYLPELAHASPNTWLHTFSNVVLPLGLSFWTFQAMSYLFDLYGGEQLEPSLLEFALYMVFFPIAISGPICRLPEMLPQFRSEKLVSRDGIGRGICRIATGLLMMQIAQLLGKGIFPGQGINGGFDSLTRWSGLDVLCLALGYGLQLFFDFAGYSHIAIGAAKVLGFTVPENFARPFTSSSLSIFWTRWHMSLSFWIRDYVYVPIAMARADEWWERLALLISMVLFGVWHKGTILFVLFGCYHGVLLILHRQAQQVQRKFHLKPSSKAWTLFSWALTMIVISLGWIFFRSNSLSQAGQMFGALLSPASYSSHALAPSLYLLVLAVATTYALALVAIDALDRYSERLKTAAIASRSETIAIFIRERWVWLAPMWVAASLLVLTILPTQGRAANAFLYRFF